MNRAAILANIGRLERESCAGCTKPAEAGYGDGKGNGSKETFCKFQCQTGLELTGYGEQLLELSRQKRRGQSETKKETDAPTSVRKSKVFLKQLLEEYHKTNELTSSPELGQHVKEVRIYLELTQKQLASESGTTSKTIGKLERNERAFTPELFIVICKALGIEYEPEPEEVAEDADASTVSLGSNKAVGVALPHLDSDITHSCHDMAFTYHQGCRQCGRTTSGTSPPVKVPLRVVGLD